MPAPNHRATAALPARLADGFPVGTFQAAGAAPVLAAWVLGFAANDSAAWTHRAVVGMATTFAVARLRPASAR